MDELQDVLKQHAMIMKADRSQVYAVHDFGSFLLIGHD